MTMVSQITSKSCLNDYEDQCVNTVYDALDDSFTVDEVSKITAELPNGKSPGPDGLTYEHIKYGEYAVANIITTTLNAITSMESVPKQFTVGNIISLYKTNKNNRYDKDNYRGITLLNVVSKIYERLIINRWMPFFQEKAFPTVSNMLTRRKRAAQMLASLSLQEAVIYNTERGSKVYCCFIDSCKAFDTKWMDGLLCKLYNLGNHGKTWRLLRNWYSTLTS